MYSSTLLIKQKPVTSLEYSFFTAEYVMSLGGLKWETFSSAVTEKYSDMYWKVDLLVSLFEAVNGVKPAILNQ